jgi:hypothetical protein
VEEGAELVVDGRGLVLQGHEKGYLRRAHRCSINVTTEHANPIK